MSRIERYMPMNQAFNMIVFAKMPYQYGKAVMCLSPAAIRLDGWSVDVRCFFVREGNSKGSLSLNKSKKSTINGKIAKKSAIHSHCNVRPTPQLSSSSSGVTAAKLATGLVGAAVTGSGAPARSETSSDASGSACFPGIMFVLPCGTSIWHRWSIRHI